MSMFRVFIITGFLLFALPSTALAFEGGTRPTPARQITYTSPCINLTGLEQYRCRRVEAMSQVRATTGLYWREQAAEHRQFQEELRNRSREFYLGPSTQKERDAFRTTQEKDRTQKYQQWTQDYQEFHTARKELRRLTRMPGQQELRMELIRQKGERIASRTGEKQSRRVILEKQRAFVRSYAQ